MRIGITGHTDLTGPTAAEVERVLDELLRAYGDVVGVTCLAAGADQLFARAVLRVGGVFDVILPAHDYRSVVPPDRRADFDALLARARQVTYTTVSRCGPAAYVAANTLLLGRVERLVAVWDGRVVDRPGGTADMVARARLRGIETTIVWPAGARRAG